MTTPENTPNNPSTANPNPGGTDAAKDVHGDDELGTGGNTSITSLPPEAQEEIRTARREAKKLRERLRKAEAAAAAAQQQRQQADAAALAEQGKFKELWEGAQPHLERLKALEAAEVARVEQLKASNAARIEKIAEDKRSLAPDWLNEGEPDRLAKWLDENEPKLGSVQAPNLNPGAQGNATSKNVPAEVLGAVNVAANYGYKLDPVKVAARAKELADRRQRGTPQNNA